MLDHCTALPLPLVLDANIRAGQVVVADGTGLAARKIERVLTNDRQWV